MTALSGKRALGYIRVSTDEQAEQGYSLDEQRERIAEYCCRHGLTLAITISDDFSGEELFQACQRQLGENRERLRGRPTELWLLHGAVTCGVCTTRFARPRLCRGATSRKERSVYRRYICHSANELKPGAYCGTSCEAGRLESMALDALRRAAEPNRLAEFARRDAEERRKATADPREALNQICDAIAALDVEEERLADLILAGISRAVVEKKIAANHERRDDLNQRLAGARARLADILSPDEAARRGEVAAERLRMALVGAENDPKLLQELFRLFLTVTIFPNARKPEITVRVPQFHERGQERWIGEPGYLDTLPPALRLAMQRYLDAVPEGSSPNIAV